MCNIRLSNHSLCCHEENKKLVCFKETPIRGLLHLAILNLIKNNPAHGSEIWLSLKNKFNIEVSKPIVYSLLRRMEHFGFLISSWNIEEGGPAKRVYRITEEGLEYLENSLKSLKKVKEVIDNLLLE